MDTATVAKVLSALLDAVQKGEVTFPNARALKSAENAIEYVLGHPFALEIAAVAFTGVEALATFVLGRFGVPAADVAALLARLGL